MEYNCFREIIIRELISVLIFEFQKGDYLDEVQKYK